MITAKKQKGIFDEQHRYEKLDTHTDPLKKLNEHIDFEFFRTTLEKYFNKDKDPNKGGRPPYDYVLMFRILILQRYYNLSDDGMEYALLDRISFMRFLGLSMADTIPDAKTIWKFRNELSREDMIKKLFDQLDKQLDKDGIIVHKGKLIDASIVEVPIQRNNREQNGQLKNGQLPEDWKTDPNKLRQKDTDAKWTSKNGEDYYGYKDHIKADEKTKLITDYLVTDASVHDSNAIDELTNKKEDGEQPLYADSAYRSEEIEELMNRKGIKSQIHEKGYRNRPLTEQQKKRNNKKSKTRARVEHIFGFMTNTMKAMYIRCRNITRARTTIGLNNLTYNLFRLIQLDIQLSS